MLKVAIMREPSPSYLVANPKNISYRKALKQHQRLRGIYKRHGYKVELMPQSYLYCASTFTQDTAFISGDQALLTNCMSKWRTKEARHKGHLQRILSKYVEVVGQMGLPGKLDVGEVVKTDDEYIVGISTKATRLGVEQIRDRLDLDLPIRTVKRFRDGVCHFGSGASYLGQGYLLSCEAFSGYPPYRRYKVITVPEDEKNGSNAVRLADGCLIVSADAPRTVSKLRYMGWDVETVDLSEYNKADGHISCLSINIEL